MDGQNNSSKRSGAQKNGTSVHRWLVFMASYLVMVVNIGFIYSIGSLFVIIIRRFNTTRAEAATIQSTMTGVFLCSGMFFGALIHKTGNRAIALCGSLLSFAGLVSSAFVTSASMLILTLGGMTGLGMSPLLISGISITAKHFDGHRYLPFILSILSTGSAVGGSVYPFIIPLLDDLYGFPGIFLISGAVSLNTFAVVILWTPVTKPTCNKTKRNANTSQQRAVNGKPTLSSGVIGPDIDQQVYANAVFEMEDIATDLSDAKTHPETHSRSGFSGKINRKGCQNNNWQARPKSTSSTVLKSVMNLFKDKVFMVYVAGLAFALPIINIIIVFIVDLYQDRGFTKREASVGLLSLNLCGGLGRLSPGFLMKIPKMTVLLVPIIACVLLALGIVCAVFVTGLSLLIAAFCVIGFAVGILVSSLNVTTASLVGTEHLGNAIGIICTTNGIGSAISSPIGGYVRDITSGYEIPLLAAVGAACASLTLMCISNKMQVQKGREQKLSGITIRVP